MKWFKFSLLLFIFSCTTREDIARKQLLENLNLQVSEFQKLNADMSVRVQGLEEALGQVSGNVENSAHQQKQENEKRVTELENQIVQLQGELKTSKEQLEAQKKLAQENQAFLKKVLAQIKGLGKKSPKKKVAKTSLYDQAMSNYGRGRYKTAKGQLKKILQRGISKDKKPRVLHNLGLISYMDKNYDQTLSYFMQLAADFPKSGYNKRGLLFSAKSFIELKKKEEARETINELAKRFPKAKETKEGKSLLKKL